MKIIFLDIDGVLISYRSHFSRKDWDRKIMKTVDVVTSDFLLNIIKHSAEELRIVVSSTWRFNSERCLGLLKSVGLESYLHSDWRTVTNYYELSGNKNYVRGDEIKHWLDSHKEIASYKILDDDSDMLSEQKEHHIHCCMMNGMSYENMRKLMSWIGL